MIFHDISKLLRMVKYRHKNLTKDRSHGRLEAMQCRNSVGCRVHGDVSVSKAASEFRCAAARMGWVTQKGYTNNVARGV